MTLANKLNEFQQLSKDFNRCKHELQDLEYKFKMLEAQKLEKDERLIELARANDELAERFQNAVHEHSRKKNHEIEELNRKIKDSEDKVSLLDSYLQTWKNKANLSAKLVDDFNDAFLRFAKEQIFDKKMISRKFRDFMILADKIKPAKDHSDIQDVLDKVEEWILHSAEEFEIQMKNAATFKQKYLKASERVDTLEEYQVIASNEEKKRAKIEDDLK